MTNPYLILQVASDADDEQIHQAYLNRLRECPPDQDPAQFELVRGAYETIKTRRRRLAHELFNSQPPTLAELAAVGLGTGDPRKPDEATIRGLLAESSPASGSKHR